MCLLRVKWLIGEVLIECLVCVWFVMMLFWRCLAWCGCLRSSKRQARVEVVGSRVLVRAPEVRCED